MTVGGLKFAFGGCHNINLLFLIMIVIENNAIKK